MRPLLETRHTLQTDRRAVDENREVEGPTRPFGEIAVGVHPGDPLAFDLLRGTSVDPLHEVRLIGGQHRARCRGVAGEFGELGIRRCGQLGTVQRDPQRELYSRLGHPADSSPHPTRNTVTNETTVTGIPKRKNVRVE